MRKKKSLFRTRKFFWWMYGTTTVIVSFFIYTSNPDTSTYIAIGFLIIGGIIDHFYPDPSQEENEKSTDEDKFRA